MASVDLVRHPGRRALALGLLAVSLLLLAVGGFVQLDDTSGFGNDKWVMPLGLLAGVAAVAAVVVALPDRAARRPTGAALLVLVALVTVAALIDDGFRFVYGHDEGELFLLRIVLALTGLALVVPRWYETSEVAAGDAGGAGATFRPRFSGAGRAVAYVFGTVALAFAGYSLGAAGFEAVECSGPSFGGECDVAGLTGFAAAATAVFLCLLAASVREAILLVRRRRPRT